MTHTIALSIWPTALLALFVPVEFDDCTVTYLGLESGMATPSGNFDIGIYDEAGNRLVSTGATALTATTAAFQWVDVTDTALAAGLYYLACVFDSGASGIYRMNAPGGELARMAGIKEQALGALPLPATAAWSPRDSATAYIPELTALTV